MPATLLTPALWAEVRTASEAGVPDKELAERFEITNDAIRQRRRRERWNTPESLAAQAAVEKARRQSSIVATGTLSRFNGSSDKTAEAAISHNLLDVVERLKQRLAPALAESAISVMDTAPERMEPRNLKDLSSLVGTVWKLTGQDKPTVSISLGAWSTVKLDADAEN